MPSLPKPTVRSRCAHARRRRHAPSEPERPDVEIIEASAGLGPLRWINIERPRAIDRAWLEEHFDFHPLDYEDVFSRNQRPKVDEYDDYLFVVLHFPRFDKVVGRLNAAEVDFFVGPDYVITLPNEPLQPLELPVRALPHLRGVPRPALLPRARLPALQDRRRLRRRLVPDAAQDGQQARAPRGGHLRGPLGGDRPRHLQRQAGDHQLPQDRPPAARGAARPRAHQALRPRGPRDLLRRHQRRVRAHLGHARELQGGRRGPRVARTSRSSRTGSTTCCGCSPRSA